MATFVLPRSLLVSADHAGAEDTPARLSGTVFLCAFNPPIYQAPSYLPEGLRLRPVMFSTGAQAGIYESAAERDSEESQAGHAAQSLRLCKRYS